MQSIFTKYLGPTDRRGSRVKAWASGWSGREKLSLTLSWDHSLNSEENHRCAAKQLAEQLQWRGIWYEGGAENGRGNVYVCAVERDSFTVE